MSQVAVSLAEPGRADPEPLMEVARSPWPERFDRIALIGRGAVFEIWKARHRRSGTLCAIKELRRDAPNHKVARQLLANESEVAGRVDSEHVVSVREANLEGESPHVVFEWLEGETLATRLDRSGCIPCPEGLWIARQIAHGLCDLLQSGFTHGKLNADNVFVERSGLVKLINLGFSRQDDRIVDDLAEREQEDDQPVGATRFPTAASQDVFGLGVVLFRMLTGKMPFSAVPPGSHGESGTLITRLRSMAPHVPSEVAGLVQRLLSRQPSRRASRPNLLVAELLRLELQSLEGAA